jgi:hypothetical protein
MAKAIGDMLGVGDEPEIARVVMRYLRDLSLADLAVLLDAARYDVTLLVPPQAPGGDRLVVTAKQGPA